MYTSWSFNFLFIPHHLISFSHFNLFEIGILNKKFNFLFKIVFFFFVLGYIRFRLNLFSQQEKCGELKNNKNKEKKK